MSQQITVSIVGASGYSGMELMKLLVRHAGVKLGRMVARSMVGRRFDEINPLIWGRADGVFERYDPDALAGSDLVFIALPSGEAMTIVPELIERGVRVIDLGGDFRLSDPDEYRAHYGREHSAPWLLEEACYGLPETTGREAIAGARLVANPGCYPSSTIIPLAPLVEAGLVELEGLVVCSMSGVSGAGRSESADLSFCEVNGSVKAYRVGRHQHVPEIRQAVARLATRNRSAAMTAAGAIAGPGEFALSEAASNETVPNVGLTFTPHLIPVSRGIYTNVYARLAAGADAEQIGSALVEYFSAEPFVRTLGATPPELKHVVGTNRADIAWHVDPAQGMVTLFSAIDNLMKGAAGTAVQNMNILFGFDECEGLR